MALGSQAANVDAASDITALVHDIYVGQVKNLVNRESKTAQVFQDAGPGDYRLEGQNMVGAVDLQFPTGSMATDGKIPDYVGMDAVNFKITPVRRYARIALDNLTAARSQGGAAFQDLATRIFDQMWSSFKSMEIRHAVGSSTGLVAKAYSATSATKTILYMGYGHAGTNPVQHIEVGSTLAWYDVSNAVIGGAGRVVSVNPSTNEIELANGTIWDGTSIAQDDLIYFATSDNDADDYFVSERGLAPNGIGTIIDPDAAITTAFNIAEGDYPRWKPYRKASSTFDHLEVKEFFLALGAHRGMDVTPEADVCIAHPAPIAQLARSLMGFQMQTQLGGDLAGGYSTVSVAGIPFVQDTFFYQDVMALVNKENLFRVTLGGEADFKAEDGSMWSRIQDFDGKEAYVGDYMNTFSTGRGANGALTGIVTPDITDTDFDNVPNY